MEKILFEKLDCSKEKEIIDYEKGLFVAFSEKNPDKWIQSKYFLNSAEKRMRSFIHYSDQEIYLAKKADNVIGAAAINFNSNLTQYEKIGFQAHHKKSIIADAMTFYMNQEFQILQLLPFFDFISECAKSRGKHLIYATCNKKLLQFYIFLDASVIDEKVIDGEKEYLICFKK